MNRVLKGTIVAVYPGKGLILSRPCIPQATRIHTGDLVLTSAMLGKLCTVECTSTNQAVNIKVRMPQPHQ